MHGGIMETVVGAIFLGILAQVLAGRYKLPAILPLLLFGMAAGPFGLELLDPSTLGHEWLEVIIHLGVAVILFEGGLSLDPKQLRQVSVPVRNLLTLGTLVTGVGAACLAHFLTGVSWGTAALFGAIVTVTGPTVIAPLLRHMVAPKKVRTILVTEGLMIDAIGAVLAYLVLLWIGSADLDLRSLAVRLLTLSATGAILGFAAGSLAVMVIRYRHMSDELRNLVILALLLSGFLVAEHQAPQSGILASVVMGLTVSAADTPNLSQLKMFKGQLTVLLISFLFILLSGQLDLGTVRQLGLEGVMVVAGLILLVRPLSVFLSIPSRHLDFKQRLLLAFTAPRGIVAAAVASLSAIQLRKAGSSDDAAILEGLVYLVIVVTCTWATVMASMMPRWLGYVDDPTRRRVILVGANPLTAALARSFGIEGWTPVVVDSVPAKLATFRDRQILAISGDAPGGIDLRSRWRRARLPCPGHDAQRRAELVDRRVGERGVRRGAPGGRPRSTLCRIRPTAAGLGRPAQSSAARPPSLEPAAGRRRSRYRNRRAVGRRRDPTRLQVAAARTARRHRAALYLGQRSAELRLV